MQHTCSNCQKTLRVPDKAAGKNVRCPACQTVLKIPPMEHIEPAVPTAVPVPPARVAPTPPPLPGEEELERDYARGDRRDRNDDPPFPVTVLIAGIAWIVFGSLIALSMLIMVVAVIVVGGAVDREGALAAGVLMGGCLGVIALGFIFVGIQTVRGTAPGTIGNGIGSIVYALFNLAGIGVLIEQRNYVWAVASAAFVLGLIVAGILALVGTPAYKEWRRVRAWREDREFDRRMRRRRRSAREEEDY